MANNGFKNIEFIDAGFRAILKSEGTHELIQEITESIYQNAVANYDAVTLANVNASDGFLMEVKQKETRWVGFVVATDKYAAAAESEDKVLTRAIT